MTQSVQIDWRITDKCWVWTELTESLQPDKIAGEPVWDEFRQMVPAELLTLPTAEAEGSVKATSGKGGGMIE